ncbi:hypothetical protein BC938DRAFT_480253, partial [Jimgerdemannia flammicorona]
GGEGRGTHIPVYTGSITLTHNQDGTTVSKGLKVIRNLDPEWYPRYMLMRVYLQTYNSGELHRFPFPIQKLMAGEALAKIYGIFKPLTTDVWMDFQKTFEGKRFEVYERRELVKSVVFEFKRVPDLDCASEGRRVSGKMGRKGKEKEKGGSVMI